MTFTPPKAVEVFGERERAERNLQANGWKVMLTLGPIQVYSDEHHPQLYFVTWEGAQYGIWYPGSETLMHSMKREYAPDIVPFWLRDHIDAVEVAFRLMTGTRIREGRR